MIEHDIGHGRLKMNKVQLLNPINNAALVLGISVSLQHKLTKSNGAKAMLDETKDHTCILHQRKWLTAKRVFIPG